MKSLSLIALTCLFASPLIGQYKDPNFPKPTSGYGADGTHPVGITSFENPLFPGENIQIYYPSDLSAPVPTLFYSHAYGGSNSLSVLGLLTFVAKKGYAIVFVPYQTVGVSVAERYDNLLAGFRQAARDNPGTIDTTRVGFLGHSFGGGASFAIAYKCFTDNNWGQAGRFLHSSAPWYSFQITQTELQAFPSDAKLIVEVYENDPVNDHRMAADMFRNINIPADEKDFILVKPDTINGYEYTAEHDLPTSLVTLDAMDYYAYYRLIDALADYAFTGNLAAKDVALGNGSAAQVTMPTGLKPLVQTDAPEVTIPESNYVFPCSSVGNPRNSFCSLNTSIAEGTLPGSRIYPNPFRSHIYLNHLRGNETFTLTNLSGQVLYQGKALAQQDFSSLPPGCYFLIVRRDSSNYRFRLIKEE
ncbi:MAG: T9SS type A sorting domain-containing protein [Bacteroidia bacterium]|nr:T9SS type A sorting domain-containing protein [Bacteroidia bacterium]